MTHIPCLYFLESEKTYKIGVTCNLWRRIYQLNTYYGYKQKYGEFRLIRYFTPFIQEPETLEKLFKFLFRGFLQEGSKSTEIFKKQQELYRTFTIASNYFTQNTYLELFLDAFRNEDNSLLDLTLLDDIEGFIGCCPEIIINTYQYHLPHHIHCLFRRLETKTIVQALHSF